MCMSVILKVGTSCERSVRRAKSGEFLAEAHSDIEAQIDRYTLFL